LYINEQEEAHHRSDRDSSAGATEDDGHQEVGLALGHEEHGPVIGGVAGLAPRLEKRLKKRVQCSIDQKVQPPEQTDRSHR